jgi:hypothetical protein
MKLDKLLYGTQTEVSRNLLFDCTEVSLSRHVSGPALFEWGCLLVPTPPFQPLVLVVHDILCRRRSSIHTTSIKCHPKAKLLIKEVRRRERERGRGRRRRRKRRVARSRELSRSMFGTFWYITRDEDEMIEL